MRWLLLPLALGIALMALYSLLMGPVRLESATPRRGGAASGNGAVGSERASRERQARGEIREPSRRQLREILREAESEGGR